MLEKFLPAATSSAWANGTETSSNEGRRLPGPGDRKSLVTERVIASLTPSGLAAAQGSGPGATRAQRQGSILKPWSRTQFALLSVNLLQTRHLCSAFRVLPLPQVHLARSRPTIFSRNQSTCFLVSADSWMKRISPPPPAKMDRN